MSHAEYFRIATELTCLDSCGTLYDRNSFFNVAQSAQLGGIVKGERPYGFEQIPDCPEC